MYKLCKTEQSAQRQRTLELGLLAAMEKSHYDQLSVTDLCDQLGVPRKSFYRYFDSKDGALYALLDHTLMEFEAFTLRSRTNQKRTGYSEMERFFQFWLQKKPLLDALQRSNLSNVLIDRAIRYAQSTSALPQRFLRVEDREIQDHLTVFAVTGLMSLVLRWHHSGYPQAVSFMADLAVRLFSHPLLSNLSLM